MKNLKGFASISIGMLVGTLLISCCGKPATETIVETEDFQNLEVDTDSVLKDVENMQLDTISMFE